MRRHFAIPVKLWALICVLVGVSLTADVLLTWVLVAVAFAFVLAQRNVRLFVSMGSFYAILGILLYFIRFHGWKMPIFSEFHVIFFWNLTAVFIVTWDFITTPPGELSAFLSSIQAPTSFILGVLVTCRFSPTMKSELRNVWMSMKNRGLTAPIQFMCHPITTCEYILVPMLLRCLQIADQLSVSAVARGAESTKRRGSYYEKKFAIMDGIWMVLWTVTTIGFLVVGGVRL